MLDFCAFLTGELPVLRRWMNRLKLSHQWVMATLLALLPLTAAVIYGGWSIWAQSHDQRLLVAHLQRVGRLEANILERVTEVERSARQYNLLRNAKFQTFLQNDLTLLAEDVAKLQQTLPRRHLILSSSARPASKCSPPPMPIRQPWRAVYRSYATSGTAWWSFGMPTVPISWMPLKRGLTAP